MTPSAPSWWPLAWGWWLSLSRPSFGSAMAARCIV
ncbi:hypothetical protein O9993_17045 [Vibrio lentus]|nr:hypothetical protein [Vibrio lentus]